MNAIDIAKKVFDIESQEVKNLSNLLTNDFKEAINLILSSKGKLIVSGMGKSGIIGKKIAASLASTGTPSFFLHPGEAYHGDLGMVEDNDIILLISNSGETDEVLKIIPFLKSHGNSIIAMSGNPSSTLGKNSNYHLNIAVEKEACPLQLAPTSSTTTTLVMGDAIVVTLMELKGFKETSFAEFHPGGSLGKRLLSKVQDVMRKDNLPMCNKNEGIKNIVHKITDGKCGLVVITEDKVVKGVITDGDLRRAMEENEKKFFQLVAKDIMTTNPKTIQQTSKLTDVSESAIDSKISSLIVTNKENNFVGIVEMYDLDL
jgi:arabinose-5-phosphate isomerase